MAILEFIIVLYTKTLLSCNIPWTAPDTLANTEQDTKLNCYRAQLIQQILIWKEQSTMYTDLEIAIISVIQDLEFKA